MTSAEQVFSTVAPTSLLGNISTSSFLNISRGTNGSPATVFGLSTFFVIIGVVGLLGNFLVIYVVLTDRRMRSSVTNIFITNLAFSDALVMIAASPDIVQFMLNKGWLIGLISCKVIRYVMVFSVYASVITQVAVCVERCIAIVYPIKAQILCSRRRILMVISGLWPAALTFALPTLSNTVGRRGPPFEVCGLNFSSNKTVHITYYKAYKYTECVTFFIVPVVIQVVLYSIMGRKLFVGSSTLRRNTGSTMRLTCQTNGRVKERTGEAIKARKGVIKMLIASVVVYFIAYLPPQIPLVYYTFTGVQFSINWSFHALVMTMGFINSAANPIFYAIFSQKFRGKFGQALCGWVPKVPEQPSTSNSTRSNIRFTSLQATNRTSSPTYNSTCM